MSECVRRAKIRLKLFNLTIYIFLKMVKDDCFSLFRYVIIVLNRRKTPLN